MYYIAEKQILQTVKHASERLSVYTIEIIIGRNPKIGSGRDATRKPLVA